MVRVTASHKKTPSALGLGVFLWRTIHGRHPSGRRCTTLKMAPGHFLWLLLTLSLHSLADCGQGDGRWFTVERVVDGDTLRLSDGRSVRVLGMNAPELERKGQPGQSLGVEAKRAAELFVEQAKGRVQLGLEQEQRDHYGRVLAHIYNPQGQSLAVSLLQQGLAFPIAVPPNIDQAECLFAAHEEARQVRRGIWGKAAWKAKPATQLNQRDTGFQRIKGRIEKVDVNSAVWLELEGALVLRIAREDWPYFSYTANDWKSLKGKSLEVQGWVTARRNTNPSFKPLVMAVRAPLVLRFD